MKSRIYFLFAGIIFLWGVLLMRGAYLQFFPHEKLKALQERQFKTVINLQSRRGAVLDRNNRELALAMKTFSLYADPKLLEGKRALARKLAKELGVPPETIYAKIKDPKKRFVWLNRQMDSEKAERIKAWGVRGLSFVDEFKRVYPNETLLASTLGMIGSEGQALEGVELSYDAKLRGSNKKMAVRRDARGRPLVANGMMFMDNPDGAEIKLTVDSELQHVLESELSTAVVDFEADQAFGIILDAQTSEILAISNAPSFDANLASRLPSEVRRNRSIADAFEPGSTMKAFVVATALRKKILQPNTRYDTENGKFQIGNKVIREAETHEKWASLTASEILAYSSNIGTTKIAFALGDEELRKGLEDFGFGSKSGVDLPGEAKGTLLPLPWKPHLLSNISFGHGIAATPLQIANAYAAIANGGKLNVPSIVQSIRDIETGELIEMKPRTLRRVLTPEQAASMRLMLTGVTAPGATGVNAKVDGFLVAGKTGTAQKVDPKGRGYLEKAYISSFAGFIPANEPKFVIYVAVDHPKRNAYYGSQVAAPIFSRLAGYAARKAGLAPVLLSEKNLVPNDRSRDNAVSIKKSSSTILAKDIIAMPEPLKAEVVPDLMKLSLREVLQKTTAQDLDVKIYGEGLVAEIDPAPGAAVPPNKRISVFLK